MSSTLRCVAAALLCLSVSGTPPSHPVKHRILFAIRGDTVHILTVRHAAQRSLSEEMGLDQGDDEGGGPVH